MIRQLIPLGIFIPVLDSLRVLCKLTRVQWAGEEVASFAPVLSSQSNECSKALWLMQPSGPDRHDRVIEFVIKYVKGKKQIFYLNAISHISLLLNNFLKILLLTIFSFVSALFCTPTKVVNHSGDVQTTYSIIMANNCSPHFAH